MGIYIQLYIHMVSHLLEFGIGGYILTNHRCCILRMYSINKYQHTYQQFICDLGVSGNGRFITT